MSRNVSVELNLMSYLIMIVKVSVKKRNVKFFILLEQFEIKVKTKHFQIFHYPFIDSAITATLGILYGNDLMSFETNYILSFRTIIFECNGRGFPTFMPYKMYVCHVSANPSFFWDTLYVQIHRDNIFLLTSIAHLDIILILTSIAYFELVCVNS